MSDEKDLHQDHEGHGVRTEDRRSAIVLDCGSRALEPQAHELAPGAKASNPKEAFGSAKSPTSTVPMPVIYELGLAMLEGALKYGRHNYRVIGVRMSTYYDAAKRHLDAWWEGEDIDPESGLPHLVKAMACLAVVRDAEMLGKVTDDRPPAHPDGWQKKYEAKVAELKARFPEPKAPFLRGDELK